MSAPTEDPNLPIEGDPEGEAPPVRRSHFVDLTPLRRSPAFARLWAGSAISSIGAQMTIVAVGLNIYDITHSTFAVSLVAGFALIPMIVFGLYGGMLADAFDRRMLLIVSAFVAWGSTISLVVLALTHVEIVWLYYVLTTLNAVSATMIMTVRSAVVPRLLPKELLPAAAALNGVIFGVALFVGPAIAGVLVAAIGFGPTYLVDVVLFISAFLGIFSLPKIAPEGEVQRPGLASLKYGWDFLRKAPNIRTSFIADIIAMTFGQPRVLFPAVGALVLGGGAVTVGALTAAGAIGALLSSVVSGRLGSVRWHGIAIRNAIMVYGGFTAAFGALVLAALIWPPAAHITSTLKPAYLPLIAIGAIFLAGAGAADNISAIFRSTMMQTAVPDNMRGRLQGVFTVVVAGGPRVGDLVTGVLASIGAIWLPPLLGGLLIVVLLAVLVRVQRGFRQYDAVNPTP